MKYTTVETRRDYQAVLFDFTSPLNISGPDRTFVSAYNGDGKINIETRGILTPEEEATIQALNGPFSAQSKAPIVCCAAVTPFIIIPCLWPIVVIAWLSACTLSVVMNVEPNKDFQRVRDEQHHHVNTLTCCCAVVNYELIHETKAPRNNAPVTTQPAAPAATSPPPVETTATTTTTTTTTAEPVPAASAPAPTVAQPPVRTDQVVVETETTEQGANF